MPNMNRSCCDVTLGKRYAHTGFSSLRFPRPPNATHSMVSAPAATLRSPNATLTMVSAMCGFHGSQALHTAWSWRIVFEACCARNATHTMVSATLPAAGVTASYAFVTLAIPGGPAGAAKRYICRSSASAAMMGIKSTRSTWLASSPNATYVDPARFLHFVSAQVADPDPPRAAKRYVRNGFCVSAVFSRNAIKSK